MANAVFEEDSHFVNNVEGASGSATVHSLAISIRSEVRVSGQYSSEWGFLSPHPVQGVRILAPLLPLFGPPACFFPSR